MFLICEIIFNFKTHFLQVYRFESQRKQRAKQEEGKP